MNIGLYNYWIAVGLMMVGLYTVIAKGNLVKKLIGLSVFQSAVVMLYVSMGIVEGGTAPIVPDSELDRLKKLEEAGGHAANTAGSMEPVVLASSGHPEAGAAHGAEAGAAHGAEAAAHGAEAVGHAAEAASAVVYTNPIPHVLMLTAIVVGVATLAVGLGLVVRIWESYGTIEEDDILRADRRLHG